MRFLALAIALLSGPTVSLGIGEFEKQIAAETTIEGKVALAEKAFDTIEGFVPRELFMSYWSIDTLEEIAATHKSILDSKGIEGLVPEYSNISRICAMEMGDYRYFFEPLKTDLDVLLAESNETNGDLKYFALRKETFQKEPLSLWTAEDIQSLIEFWIISGEGEESSDIEDLLHRRWSKSDIEYWDLVFSKYRLSPNQMISAMKVKLLIGNADPFGLAESVANSPSGENPFWLAPEIAENESEVSYGGPRLD